MLSLFFLSLDINECAMQGICDNGRCVNAQGGFKCECNQGYALDGDGKSCLGKRKRNKFLLFMAGRLFLASNSDCLNKSRKSHKFVSLCRNLSKRPHDTA